MAFFNQCNLGLRLGQFEALLREAVNGIVYQGGQVIDDLKEIGLFFCRGFGGVSAAIVVAVGSFNAPGAYSTGEWILKHSAQ